MSDFDAVLFDAGGVLVVPTPSATGELLVRHGGTDDPETLLRAHFVAAHAMDRARVDGDHAEWPAYHVAYVRAGGVGPDREQEALAAFSAEFDHWMWCHPMPGARDALAGLADRGIPIGIVSNAAGQVEGDLARLGICRRVEETPDGTPEVVLDADGTPEPQPVPVACVVDSHVVGVSKPAPEIFETALAAIGLPASARVAYVGDTVFYDVRAAVAAGLTPLLHDPFGLHRDDPHPDGPHRTLAALADLHELV